MNENPPSSREGGSDQPANHLSAARDEASADTAPLGSEPFPWPPREGESAITAGGRTWREVMFAPASFYRRMPAAAPLGGALVYYLIVGVLASGIQLFWDMVGLVVLPRPAADSAWMMALPASAGDALTSFFFAPLILIAGLFVLSAVTHILLKLFGGARAHYGTTVRVFAYAQSPHLLVILPFIGVFIAMIWTLTISIIGLREAHRTTTLKAASAILLPAFAIFFLLMMFLVVVVMGAALLAR